MKRRVTLFEVSSITVFGTLGITLPALNIDNSGVLFVAGILTLIFLTNRNNVFAGLGSFQAQKSGMSSGYDHSNNER